MLWQNLNPIDFEIVILRLVQALGFTSAERVGGTADRGEDITAFEPARHAGIKPGTRRWVFQCKHCRTLRRTDIVVELDRFIAQKIDTWVLVTTAIPSSELRRWLGGVADSLKYHFRIEAWWRDDLDSLAKQCANELIRALPTSMTSALHLEVDAQEQPPHIEHILSLCSDATKRRVERFGHGKYLPQLYVRRALTEQLEQFHATEAVTANELQTLAVRATAKITSSCQHMLSSYPLPDQHTPDPPKGNWTIALRRKTKHLPHPAIPDYESPNLAAAVAFLNLGYANSSEWIVGLNVLLSKLATLTSSLSHHIYVKQRQSLDLVIAAARDLSRHFVDIPYYEMSGSVVESHSILPALTVKQHLDTLEHLTTALTSCHRCTLVVTDRAGGGKTNLFCHFALQLAKVQPTLLLFGKEHFDADDIVSTLDRDIFLPLGLSSRNLEGLDKALGDAGCFLNILIDGVNETRRIRPFDHAIATLLEWAHNHRVKISISCRDIYWHFFNYNSWAHHVRYVFQDHLHTFSPAEYHQALPAYLAYYNLRCELSDQAQRACQHPLLMRFFCEAYGSIAGPLVPLGRVRDIRLKELFDEYYHRKMQQIAQALGHRNADAPNQYLQKVAAFMFTASSSIVPSSRIEDITGEADVSSESSMYLRLLDEDIIIEEQPSDDIDIRQVTFVYEEFMEYLLARSILTLPKRFGVAGGVLSVFRVLRGRAMRWTNIRGVTEYVGLMTLHQDFGYPRADGIVFLSLIATESETMWLRAFWSIVGKCPEKDLRSDLFDVFWAAVRGFADSRMAKSCLESMNRYSQKGSERLAAVLLWSVSVPKVIGWVELDGLSGLNHAALVELRARLVAATKVIGQQVRGRELPYGSLLRLFHQHLGAAAAEDVSKAMRVFGRPQTRIMGGDPAVVVRVIWKAVPEFTPMLINGLFSDDESVRRVCADRIRFVEVCKREVVFLLEALVACPHLAEVAGILGESIKVLRAALRKGEADPRA